MLARARQVAHCLTHQRLGPGTHQVEFRGGEMPNHVPPASAQGQLPSFTAVASMTLARFGHTTTLLPSGKVLITGGSEL